MSAWFGVNLISVWPSIQYAPTRSHSCIPQVFIRWTARHLQDTQNTVNTCDVKLNTLFYWNIYFSRGSRGWRCESMSFLQDHTELITSWHVSNISFPIFSTPGFSQKKNIQEYDSEVEYNSQMSLNGYKITLHSAVRSVTTKNVSQKRVFSLSARMCDTS